MMTGKLVPRQKLTLEEPIAMGIEVIFRVGVSEKKKSRSIERIIDRGNFFCGFGVSCVGVYCRIHRGTKRKAAMQPLNEPTLQGIIVH